MCQCVLSLSVAGLFGLVRSVFSLVVGLVVVSIVPGPAKRSYSVNIRWHSALHSMRGHHSSVRDVMSMSTSSFVRSTLMTSFHSEFSEKCATPSDTKIVSCLSLQGSYVCSVACNDKFAFSRHASNPIVQKTYGSAASRLTQFDCRSDELW